MKSIINYNQNDYKSLPENGWFKLCFRCETITSKFVIICHKYKYYYCKKCMKNKMYFYHKISYPNYYVEIGN